MKLSRKDIGKEVFLLTWYRGCAAGVKKSKAKIDKVGSVNVTLDDSRYKLRVVHSNEFSITLSEGSTSDSWVKLYFSENDIKLDEELGELKDWFSLYSRRTGYTSLSMSQLKRIKDIISE